MECLLMQKSYAVAKVEIDEDNHCKISKIIELYSPERVPVGVAVKNGQVNKIELNNWWHGRSIPASRDGIDNVLDSLHVSATQDLLGKSLGLSLSDQYWICPCGSEYTWDKVNFFENDFSEDMGNLLFGSQSSPKIDLMSPDNTSDGWLKKKWKIIDGKRCLIKGASGQSRQEPYNEAIACAIMKRLSIPHVDYRIIKENRFPYSVCEDFISKDTELVTAWYLMNTRKKPNHISVYQHFVSCCEYLGIAGATDFIDKMITLDYLIVNEDRHQNNFGVIRNTETLKFVGFAPIFDSGTSLWMRTPTQLISSDYQYISCRPFKSTHEEQIKLVKSFDWLNLNNLAGIEDECNEILAAADYIDDVRRSKICSAIGGRVKMLEKIVENHNTHSFFDIADNDVKSDIAYSSEQDSELEL